MIHPVSDRRVKMLSLRSICKAASVIVNVAVVFVSVWFVVFSNETAQSVRNSLSLCFYTVIPSLFPFLVMSPLIISTGVAEWIGKLLAGPVRILFSLQGHCAFPIVIGLVSGCPSGAGAVGDMYNCGKCTKQEGEKLISFCNNISPSFMISAVGVGMLGNISYGLLLFFIQILSSVIVGVIICRVPLKKKDDYKTVSQKNSGGVLRKVEIKRSESFADSVTSAVKNAAVTLISISSFIVFFGIISDQLSVMCSGLELFSNDFEIILKMFLEFTAGCRAASSNELGKALVMISAGAGWSGISAYAQVSSIVHDFDFSMKYYFAGKLIQGFLSAIFMSIAIIFII